MTAQPLVRGLLPARRAATHKGQAGRVVVVAGSVGLSGAAALCAQAAARTGAGLVVLGIPQSLYKPLAAQLKEPIYELLPETKDGSLSQQAMPAIVEQIEHADAVAIGPGLSQHAETKELVRQLVPKLAKPAVLDADALNALADDPKLLKRLPLPAIVTPHPGEMARLTRLGAEAIQRDRERIATEFAAAYRVVTVLKGHRTVVASFDGRVYINETGNPGMASGGVGDVLTGMIAALLGQGLELFDAAQLGVYVHGRAGDLAAESRGQIGLIASDLLDRIPHAIREYQQLT